MAFYATKEEILNNPEIEAVVTDMNVDKGANFIKKKRPLNIGNASDTAFVHENHDYCSTLSNVSPKRFVVVRLKRTKIVNGDEKKLYSYYDRRLRQLGNDMFLEASDVYKNPLKSSSPAFCIVKTMYGAYRIYYLHSCDYYKFHDDVIVSGPIESIKNSPVVVTNKLSKENALFDPSTKTYLTKESSELILPSQDPTMPLHQMGWVVTFDKDTGKYCINNFETNNHTCDYIPYIPILFTDDLIISDGGIYSINICTKDGENIHSKNYKMGEKWVHDFIHDVFDKSLDELSILKLIVERKPEAVLDFPSSILGNNKYLKSIMESVQIGIENNMPVDSSEFEKYLESSSKLKQNFVELAKVSVQARSEKLEEYKHDLELYENSYLNVVSKEIESQTEYNSSLKRLKSDISNMFSDIDFEEKQ